MNWNNVFFKTYYEQQSIIQNLVHFDCIWLIHIALYWFYTVCNSPKIYHQSNGLPPMPAMCWSFTMLGGAVLALVMILVTLAEFCIIPTTWNNTSHLTCQLLFLLTTLALTGGPLIYIFFYNNGIKGGLPLVISMVQFGLAVVVTLLFALIPSRRMFGDRVASKPQKYLASQTFMASYPPLSQNMHMMSFTFGFSSSCASLWSSQASWIRPLHESGHDHTCNYACDGSHAVLPGYILVVCHLEYGVQHCTFVHPGVVNLDTLE